MPAGWLSPPEVSEKYRIPLRTVQSACQHGALQAEKLGRYYLILPEDAEKFAQAWGKRRQASQNGSSLPGNEVS